MKIALIFLCLVLIAGATHAAQGADAPKPGLWERRTLKMTMNGQDMLPQIKAAQEQMRKSMVNMPPEQRKKMEAAMGDFICVSAEMAKNEWTTVPRPEGANCDEPKLNRSGDRTSFEMACKQGGGTVTSKGETAVTGDQITIKVESVTTEANAKHVMVVEEQMKFISSDCGGIKPRH
ncbi:MAG: DUF3617 domain-containing protein [Desulfobulbaceae bacterium]|nr:DUF3617 domain-containing protein [Desulfobulbaceae bacterium]